VFLRPSTRGTSNHYDQLKKESMSKANAKTKPNEKFTAEQMIDALTKSKGMIAPAARSLRCSRNTVKRYLREYVTVEQAQKDEREAMTDTAELSLYNAVLRGEAWAVCFYLKTQGKRRGYVERAEVTGKDGAPIEHDHTHRNEDREEHFDRLFAQLDAYRAGIDGGDGRSGEGVRLDSNGAHDSAATLP